VAAVIPAGHPVLFHMVQPEQAGTIQESFERFHALNPWVFTSLEALTQQYLTHGHKRIGIGMLFEVLRWQYGVTMGDDFKLNNNYRSRYVRLLIEQHPEWEQAFSTRELRTA
jgi:hypothetical protein